MTEDQMKVVERAIDLIDRMLPRNMEDYTIKHEISVKLRTILEEERNCENGWWCPTCKEEVDGSRVTFQERHDTCGTLLQS